MKLESLPRFRLAEFPTPIHHLETLSKAYNGPEIYMKRDATGWQDKKQRE